MSRRDLPFIDPGDRREPIFRDDKDRESFLQTVGEACVKTAWCLMNNDFHLGGRNTKTEAFSALVPVTLIFFI
jgi:hypothetical protein